MQNNTSTTSSPNQAEQPTGMAGHIMGYLMAYLNDGMNQQAVKLLDVQPTDRILEIGFGPGKALQRIARMATSGFTAGIDYSEVMVEQARQRIKDINHNGKVEVALASVMNIPYANATFNKVCSINSFQFWPDQDKALREIWRVLQQNGLLLICIRGKATNSNNFFSRIGFDEDQIAIITKQIEQAGFQITRIDQTKVKFMTAISILAHKL